MRWFDFYFGDAKNFKIFNADRYKRGTKLKYHV